MEQNLPRILARLSWLLPFAAMLPVGLYERGSELLPFPGRTLIAGASVAALLAFALGVATLMATSFGRAPAGRREAFLGTGAGATLLLVTQTAAISGEHHRVVAQAELERATEQALRDHPGWSGGARFGRARVFAVGVDRGSSLADRLLAPFEGDFELVLIAADNTLGTEDLELDLENARAVSAQGSTKALSRAELRAHARPELVNALLAHFGPYKVPAGTKLEQALLLFPAHTAVEQVLRIEVLLQGELVSIPGRYFTLENKRAIDAMRTKPRNQGEP